MLTAPYSIYINKRPLRVAFLIEDKPESLAIIDAIFAYNHDRWGGRYNPLVVTDGQMLTDAWWSFLEAVDPGADAAGTDTMRTGELCGPGAHVGGRNAENAAASATSEGMTRSA